MAIRTVYIRAKSKRDINAALDSDVIVYCTEYRMGDTLRLLVKDLPVGTVVKVYNRVIGGNPYAKSYGNVAKRKDGTLYIK